MLTLTNYQLEDVGRGLSWSSFSSFIKYLPPTSATVREIAVKEGWETQFKTNTILADIYDLLQAIDSHICAGISHKKPQKITPYPRPGKKDDSKKKIGKGALPLPDLREWFRRRQNNGRND